MKRFETRPVSRRSKWVAARVRGRRRELAIRQDVFADRMGIPTRWLSELENGLREWTEPLIVRAAALLGTEPVQLARNPPR